MRADQLREIIERWRGGNGGTYRTWVLREERLNLWVTPIPRPLRFYDSRHIYATRLRRADVDSARCRRAWGTRRPR